MLQKQAVNVGDVWPCLNETFVESFYGIHIPAV